VTELARLMKLFAGLNRAHGTYALGTYNAKKKKLTGKAKTLKDEVTLDKWRAHVAGEIGIGIVPIDDAGTVSFAAIDVDDYDINLERLETRVGELKLPLVVCRTKSGGAHLYLFLKSKTKAGPIRESLMEWAIALGHPNVEVFPKQSELAGEDDVGSWINMPYFDGENTTRYAIKGGDSLSLLDFLDYAEGMQVTARKVKSLKIKTDDTLDGAPPCLQHLAQAGFPEGTRNKALFNMGVLAKLRYGDEWREKLDEFNQRYMVPPLSSDEVQTVTKSLGRKDYFYTCSDSPIASVCNRPICQSRKYGIGNTAHDPGVVLDGLAKIMTEPPTWLLNVDGRRVRLESTDDLINQPKFVRLCVEILNVLPQRVTRSVWDAIVRGLLEKVEEIAAPSDAGTPGQFAFLVEKFLSDTVPARNREELLLGRPWQNPDTGFVYFRSIDLLEFLDRHKMRINARQAWVYLREAGAHDRPFNVKHRCVRCWGVRKEGGEDVSIDPPEMSDDEF